VLGRFLRAFRFPGARPASPRGPNRGARGTAPYDPAVAPLLLAAAGVVALGVAAAILRSFGPRYRVGRLLAVVAQISVAEAVRLAEAGAVRYIRIDGRIDSEAEFEDSEHRPLVLRRTTFEWRAAGRRSWTRFDTRTEAVPFVVREGLDEIGVDVDQLGDGLIVTPRESVGAVRDIEEMSAAGIPQDAEARLLVELVSSVDHAAVIGVPARAADGRITIGPGLGRPLIVSTLEHDEAMRVLTGGATGRSRIAIACLSAGIALVGLAAAWWLVDSLLGGGVATALAASPDPTLRPGGDTRSSGGGPGLVGEPLLAVLGVIGIGLLSVLATTAWLRLTSSRRD
jgi:hypothetical protein